MDDDSLILWVIAAFLIIVIFLRSGIVIFDLFEVRIILVACVIKVAGL